MRMTDQVYRWEVDEVARRLKSVEERLNRRDQERFRNAMLALWILWAAVVAGLVVLAALN
jgi:hypothetical protein